MKKVVTAQHVAKQAGVSPTTVSFVMNNVLSGNISEATRDRVLKVADELGYVPHALAKSLAKGRSDNIGLFLIQPHPQVFADPYIPNIITGIRQAIQADDFRILVEQIRIINDVDMILTMLKSGQIAGAIVTQNIWTPQQLKQLANFPVVCLSSVEDSQLNYVAIDHLKGINELARHIHSLNRAPIGVITYASLESNNIQSRLAVFRETLAELDYFIDDNHIREGAYHPQSGYDAMESLLKEHPDIQAVYCINDMMAVGALSYLNQHNINVPQDIAIVGYDDIRVSAFLNPPLTTVRAPEVMLGESAGDLLLQLINDQTPDILQQLLPTQLIIRQSCGTHLS
jgi:DNA-binding LacI/PurR family transcriptional regulator